VRLDGRYGKAGHRRQLYRCLPANGEPSHRFTELLPREEAWHDACETCERPVHSNEGPHAARRYQFVARGIAEAPQAVGVGTSYRQAGLVARERAERLRVDPETGEPRMTRHGQLVGDWVEVFARSSSSLTVPTPGPKTARCCRRPAVFGPRSGHRTVSDRLPGLLRDGL